MKRIYKLSPSDLTFLWDECKRCFYLKVTRGYRRPAIGFPKIFIRIDQLMKDHYLDQSTKAISPSLPEGKVHLTGRWVESESISDPDHQAEVYITGMFDTVLKFDNGSFGVVDFKTTEVKDEHVNFYARQLQAYAYALEHAAPTKLSLKPISVLGLLCFEPRQMDQDEQGRLTYSGQVVWQPCPLDENTFLSFIREVMAVLDQEEPPDAGEKCEYCKYRELARVTNV
jgi:hypothetical protein